MKITRYRVEWKHNGNWRMEVNGGLTFNTRADAQAALEAEKEKAPSLELRLVEVQS